MYMLSEKGYPCTCTCEVPPELYIIIHVIAMYGCMPLGKCDEIPVWSLIGFVVVDTGIV